MLRRARSQDTAIQESKIYCCVLKKCLRSKISFSLISADLMTRTKSPAKKWLAFATPLGCSSCLKSSLETKNTELRFYDLAVAKKKKLNTATVGDRLLLAIIYKPIYEHPYKWNFLAIFLGTTSNYYRENGVILDKIFIFQLFLFIFTFFEIFFTCIVKYPLVYLPYFYLFFRLKIKDL